MTTTTTAATTPRPATAVLLEHLDGTRPASRDEWDAACARLARHLELQIDLTVAGMAFETLATDGWDQCSVCHDSGGHCGSCWCCEGRAS